MTDNMFENIFNETSDEFLGLLRNCVKTGSISGREKNLVLLLNQWAANFGFETDLFEISEYNKNAFLWEPKHLPLDGRPVLVISLPKSKNPSAKTLAFNAHSDTVSEGESAAWTMDPFSGHFDGKDLFGLGSCDTKGPLVSALWAMFVINKMHPEGIDGNIFLEVVPGEEDCVGVGTLGSVARGYSADAMIVLEPTDSYPCCASRGGLRFAVEAKGRAIHGTVRWLGRDAILSMRRVLSAIDELQDEWNNSSSSLFSEFPYARPMAVDKISGGKWQGMVCDRCRCEGYLETLPEDDLMKIKERFERELTAKLPDDEIELHFTENYSGHYTSPENPLCEAAKDAFESVNSSPMSRWKAFNAGCESGIRAKLSGTPTLVWGPGKVEHAHSPDEKVNFDSVRKCAEMFVITAERYLNFNTGTKGHALRRS